jgi:hypothetical protein
MDAILGDFEYIKPKQSRELLTLRADGTASYEEIGDNGLESYVASGPGTTQPPSASTTIPHGHHLLTL